ncbi:MAG: hypothetical protein ACQETE_02485 [Bacteroidota bacterium]
MNDIATLSHRNAQLEDVARQLKTEFVGLDAIIDRIINLMRSWYLMPEIQQRPQVINLWGMTGVGKTSLVDRLVTLLSFQSRYRRVTMGEEKYSNSLGSVLSDAYEHFHEEPFVLALDEFQHARTFDAFGHPKDNKRNKVLWELLGSGSVEVDPLQMLSRSNLAEVITDYRYLLRKGVKVKAGRVIQEKELFSKHTDHIFYSGSEELETEDIPFVPNRLVDDILDVYQQRFDDKYELRQHLFTLNGPQTVQFLEETLDMSYRPYQLDSSKAIIFIIGNIDELYQMHADQNPDHGADQFHELSKKVDISDVKNVLQDYFRNEQLARLGNNHVIYPAFSQQNYEDIIAMELEKLADHVAEQFDMQLRFGESVHRLIYREGVYPSQGTRPVFSTIYQLVESKLGAIICEPYLHEHTPDTIRVRVENQMLICEYHQHDQRVHQLSLSLEVNLEKKRKPLAGDFQALMAVHESGHTIANIWLRGRIPDSVISQSLVQERGGQTVSFEEEKFYTRRSMIDAAAVLLAGYCAERLVFGEDRVSSGSSSDISRATRLLARLIRHGGMGSQRANIINPGTEKTDSLIDQHHEMNQELKQLLREAEQRADVILHERKTELLKLSNYLSDHRRISDEEIIDLLELEGDTLGESHYSYREVVKGQSNSKAPDSEHRVPLSNGVTG